VDEPTSFEPQSVLVSRHAGWNRLAVLIPVLALVAVLWAGLSDRSAQAPSATNAVAVVASTAEGAASPTAVKVTRDPQYPAEVLGLQVERLPDVQDRGIARDRVVAVAGWYVATEITDCPPLAAIYRLGSLPEIRGGDPLAYCQRHGVLYASRPDLPRRLSANSPDDNPDANAGVPGVAASLSVGVFVPPELETIGADATPVVVVAHFTPAAGCRGPRCTQELLIDYLGWALTPAA
jgi:hypothetical protein